MKEGLSQSLARELGFDRETQFCCRLLAQGASVRISTDVAELREVLPANFKGFENMIPGFSVDRVEGDGERLVILENEDSGLYFDEQKRTVYLFGGTTDFVDGQAIAWVSSWLMERQRQERSLFTMHSSAVTMSGKGVLLLGHSGAGKTSIMLNLCQKYGASVVSNDLTVVRHDFGSKRISLVEGTKEIRLRLASVEQNFPSLKKYFASRDSSAWESKIVVHPEDIGLTSEQGQPQITSIFEVHLDSKGTDGLLVRQEEQVPIRYRLYEDMARIVRGSAISVFDSRHQFLGYMPSLDSENIHAKRVACIEEMVDGVGVVSVSGGNIEEITEAIFSIVSGQN